MPMLSRVAFLCHQKWDSASKVHLIPATTPVLMLSGRKDEIVPQAHMHELERLFREAKMSGRSRGRRPGKLVEYREGSHSE
jgi:abhydrolase domain-containing protein 13